MTYIIIWFFIIAGGFASINFIYNGVKKYKTHKSALSLKDFYRETSFRDSPGKLLIIEGAFGLITALILGFAAIFWL